MSILSEAYGLAKDLIRSPHRQQLKSVLDSLTFTKADERDTATDRSQLGYFARHQYVQALGFLLVDRIQLPFSLPTLSPEEREIINAFHEQLVNLDLKCISAMIEKFPSITDSVNPYSEYKYSSHESKGEYVFFDDNQVSKLVDAFSSHPGIHYAIDSMPSDFSRVDLGSFLRGVIEVKKRLQAVGVHDSPRELMQIAFNQGINDQNTLILRNLTSLATVRASLELLNQLLFQASQFDQLIMFDDESVINILQNNVHVVGHGITFMYQLNSKNFLVEPNDLVLLNGKVIDNEKTLLCWVQNTGMSFSEQSGNIGELSVWLVDENLSPFSGLVKK